MKWIFNIENNYITANINVTPIDNNNKSIIRIIDIRQVTSPYGKINFDDSVEYIRKQIALNIDDETNITITKEYKQHCKDIKEVFNHLGLYKVYWTTGDYSLASVYNDQQGNRHIAPTNWTQPSIINDEIMEQVESVFKLHEQ